jgi:hypothetical protein
VTVTGEKLETIGLRPLLLSLALRLLALALLIVVVLPAVRKKREEAFQE